MDIDSLLNACWDMQADQTTMELEATLAMLAKDSPHVVDSPEYRMLLTILLARKEAGAINPLPNSDEIREQLKKGLGVDEENRPTQHEDGT